MTPIASVGRIVGDVEQAGRIDAASVSRILGTTLTVSDDEGPFRLHQGRVDANGLRIDVDFREPVVGRGARAGAILVLNVAGACVARQDVLARFGKLEISGVPRGRSENEHTSWAKAEPWGNLSFGFAEHRPDCLDTISFKFHPIR